MGISTSAIAQVVSPTSSKIYKWDRFPGREIIVGSWRDPNSYSGKEFDVLFYWGDSWNCPPAFNSSIGKLFDLPHFSQTYKGVRLFNSSDSPIEINNLIGYCDLGIVQTTLLLLQACLVRAPRFASRYSVARRVDDETFETIKRFSSDKEWRFPGADSTGIYDAKING